MFMFLQGEIVFGVCPNADGTENIAPHYMVVLGESSEGVLCMFTTSLKERTGGAHAFTPVECRAAGFSKPCRFDPSRLVLYKPADKHVLKRCSGRLDKKTVQRMIHAAMSVKASYVTYKHAA